MAYSPSEKYPGAVDVDPDYQGGKFRDNNPSTTNNGSPLKAIDRNELLARDEAIMNDAGFEYSGVADTPQDSQLFKAYKASLGNGANLLSNHNFLIQTPDDSQPLPSATPTSYPPGHQIFSGVFANETTGITNLTYIDGRVSFSGGDLYFSMANTGGIERLTSDQLAASVADFDGKPRTRGVSFALVGDEYRVTVGIDALEDAGAALTPLGSVKFEQGSVATGHEVGEALSVTGSQIQPLNNFWNIYLRPEMIKTGATVAFPPSTGPGITIPAGSQFAYGYFADTELTGVWIDETGGMRWAAGTMRQEVPFDGSDDRLASDIRASFYDQDRVQHYLTGAVTKAASMWEVRITPADLSAVGATSMRALLPASAAGGVDWLSGEEVSDLVLGPDIKIIDVNAGSNVSPNQRFEIDIESEIGEYWEPDNMHCIAEVYNDGTTGGIVGWGETGFIFSGGGFGVKASVFNDAVVVQTGSTAIGSSFSTDSGNPFGDVASAQMKPSLCRVKVWKIK